MFKYRKLNGPEVKNEQGKQRNVYRIFVGKP